MMAVGMMGPMAPTACGMRPACRGAAARSSCRPISSAVSQSNVLQRRPANRSSWQGRSATAASRCLRADATGGGGGSIGGDGFGGGGGSGGNDDSSDSRGGAEALLLAAGKSLEQLPVAIQDAIRKGTLTNEALQKYLDYASSNGFLRALLKIPGFRDRMLGDDGFLAKVAIELGIGLFCKLAAEKTKRGKAFKSQVDFVLANVMMALIADFMLVWLSAPRLLLAGNATSVKTGNAVSKFLASCPDNAFQVLPAGAQSWSIAQRTVAILRNGTKLLGVGFGASMFGVTVTNSIIAIRSRVDTSFTAPNAPQDVVSMSAAYAAYMASSSNLRYQVVAGVVEERFIEVLVHNQLLRTVLSFGVRTGNTFLGSLLWVDFLRLIGLQKKE